MLQVHHCSIITKNQRCLLDSLSFTLNANDKIAIIGEEGNGKSTLLKGIVDPELIHDFAFFEGQVIQEGPIGFLQQVFPSEWLDQTGLDYLLKDRIDDILLEQYNRYGEVMEVLAELHVSADLLDQTVATMSGGEKVKLQLAKCLLGHPEILFLDEPTNDLDLETLIWLEHFIQESELGILFVSHDETLLENCATGILHLEQTFRKTKPRWTFEHLGYREYCEKRQFNLVRQEKIASKEKAEYEKQLAKFERLYSQVDHALNTVSRQNPAKGRLLKKKMKTVKVIESHLKEKPLTSKPDVEEAVNLFFPDTCGLDHCTCILDFHLDCLQIKDKVLATQIDLQVYGKQKVCIVGRNGSGKSTLIRHLLPYVKGKVGYMPQNYEELLPLEQNAVDYLTQDRDTSYRNRVSICLGSLKFTYDEMMQPMQRCSQGQKAKICLLKFVLEEVDVLVLDEPTRNLSPLSTPVVRKLLRNYQGCIISVSHDRKYIDEVCERVYTLDETGLHG